MIERFTAAECVADASRESGGRAEPIIAIPFDWSGVDEEEKGEEEERGAEAMAAIRVLYDECFCCGHSTAAISRFAAIGVVAGRLTTREAAQHAGVKLRAMQATVARIRARLFSVK